MPKGKKYITRDEKKFAQGYMCAVANLCRKDGANTYTTETFYEGLAGGIKACIAHDVDPYDIEELEKHFK